MTAQLWERRWGKLDIAPGNWRMVAEDAELGSEVVSALAAENTASRYSWEREGTIARRAS